jgi:GNAT superfamily N-acetyltransferase
MSKRTYRKMPVKDRRPYILRHNPRRTWYWSQTFDGTMVFETSICSVAAPVAIMWVQNVGNTTIDILGMYVGEALRRAGLGRELLDYAIEQLPHVDTVMTQSGTNLGVRFMDAYGFKRQKNGDWIYKVKR